MTYRATVDQLEQRLLVRVRTLAGTINHVAMATSDWSIIQHMVEEVAREDPEIKRIVVVGRSPRKLLAANAPEIRGSALESLGDEHLRDELQAALNLGRFGKHYNHDHHGDHARDLVVITPLEPVGMHHGTHGGASSGHGGGANHHAPGHQDHSHTPIKDSVASEPSGPAMAARPYRGAILIRVSERAVSSGTFDVMTRYLLALIAAIFVILVIAYLTLEIQVLRPVKAIIGAMNRRKDGDAKARVSPAHRDEIGAVARTLNETLDKEDAQGKQLSDFNAQLSQALVRAESANVAKSTFLANMSHELRTPLNAIIGFSDILQNEALGPVGSVRYLEYSKDINDAGRHLLDLINDILDLSKIEAEKEDLYEENLDVREVIRAALSLVRQRAHKNGIELAQKIAEDLPLLSADERKLKQILINLLTNAVKYSNSGGTVTIAARWQSSMGVVLEVIDTGIGIASQDLAQALSQFGQVDGEQNRKQEGTGLGLPLTKALVELHGGSLEIQSELGEGTTVRVRFPVSRVVTEFAASA